MTEEDTEDRSNITGDGKYAMATHDGKKPKEEEEELLFETATVTDLQTLSF